MGPSPAILCEAGADIRSGGRSRDQTCLDANAYRRQRGRDHQNDEFVAVSGRTGTYALGAPDTSRQFRTGRARIFPLEPSL